MFWCDTVSLSMPGVLIDIVCFSVVVLHWFLPMGWFSMSCNSDLLPSNGALSFDLTKCGSFLIKRKLMVIVGGIILPPSWLRQKARYSANYLCKYLCILMWLFTNFIMFVCVQFLVEWKYLWEWCSLGRDEVPILLETLFVSQVLSLADWSFGTGWCKWPSLLRLLYQKNKNMPQYYGGICC